MHPVLGPYHVRDIEFTAAFDVNRTKVGRPLAEAIFAEPNNTQRFANVPGTAAQVFRGPTHEGLGKYLGRSLELASGESVNVEEVLRDTHTDVVVSYLPVGSEKATRWYAEQVLEAGCAFVNCIPVFIASDKDWRKRFEARGLPVIGDDIKSQVGATIVHRGFTELGWRCHRRGALCKVSFGSWNRRSSDERFQLFHENASTPIQRRGGPT